MSFVERINKCKWYNFSKVSMPTKDRINRIYGDDVEIKDNGDSWLVSAESETFSPATLDEIQEVEQLYKTKLPDDYRDFLLQTNGAHLFMTIHSGNNPICWCSILSTSELIEAHNYIYFVLEESGYYAPDKHTSQVNLPSELHYFPIADLTNRDYIAVSTNPEFPNDLFRIYVDGGYYPHTEEYLIFHKKISATSFADWLDKVLDSYGAFGLG